MARTKYENFPISLPRWIITNPNLTPSEKLLLFVLASHLNSLTGDCYPSVNRCLVLEVKVNRDTIYSDRKHLKRLGLIDYKDGVGGRDYAAYKLLWVNLSGPELDTLHKNIERGLLSEMKGQYKRLPTVPKRGTVTVPKRGTVTVPKEGTRTSYNLTDKNTTTEKPAAVSFSSPPSKETPTPPVSSENVKKLVAKIVNLGGIDEDRTKAIIQDYGYDNVRTKLEIIHSRPWHNPVGALISSLKDNWQRGDSEAIERHERRFLVTRKGIIKDAIAGQLFDWQDLIRAMGSEGTVRAAVEKGDIKEYDY